MPGNQGQALLWKSAPSGCVSSPWALWVLGGGTGIHQEEILPRYGKQHMGDPWGLWFAFYASGWAIWRLPETQPVWIFHQNISNCKFFGNNDPQVIIPGRADSDLLHKSSSWSLARHRCVRSGTSHLGLRWHKWYRQTRCASCTWSAAKGTDFRRDILRGSADRKTVVSERLCFHCDVPASLLFPRAGD